MSVIILSSALQKVKTQRLLSVGVALALKEKPDLHIDDVEWLNSAEFRELTTSDASNNEGKLVARVEYVRDKLLGRNQ